MNCLFRICGLLSTVILVACSDGAKQTQNDSTEADLVKQDMAGIWLRNKCSVDGDTNLYRQRYLYRFNTNGTFVLEYTLYSPNDTNCVGDPITRTRESGTFSIGNKITTTNTSPVEAFELNVEFTDVVVEGDRFLGVATLNPFEPVDLPWNGYGLVRVNRDSGTLLLADYFTNLEVERLTLLEDDFILADSLPANYDNYQTVSSFQAPGVNELAGTWQGVCFTSGNYYYRLDYQLTNQGAITYTESVFAGNDSSCSGQVQSSITYTGTYALQTTPVSVDFPESKDTSQVNFTLTAKTGDTNNPTGELYNWAMPRLKNDLVLVDLTRGIWLESSGSGNNNRPIPTYLGSIYFLQ